MSKRDDGEENGRKQGEENRMNGWKPKMGDICGVKLKERRGEREIEKEDGANQANR